MCTGTVVFSVASARLAAWAVAPFACPFFDEGSPVDSAAFYVYGPRRECPDVAGGVRRSVMPAVAYHRVRGAVSPRDALRFSR